MKTFAEEALQICDVFEQAARNNTSSGSMFSPFSPDELRNDFRNAKKRWTGGREGEALNAYIGELQQKLDASIMANPDQHALQIEVKEAKAHWDVAREGGQNDADELRDSYLGLERRLHISIVKHPDQDDLQTKLHVLLHMDYTFSEPEEDKFIASRAGRKSLTAHLPELPHPASLLIFYEALNRLNRKAKIDNPNAYEDPQAYSVGYSPVFTGNDVSMLAREEAPDINWKELRASIEEIGKDLSDPKHWTQSGRITSKGIRFMNTTLYHNVVPEPVKGIPHIDNAQAQGPAMPLIWSIIHECKQYDASNDIECNVLSGEYLQQELDPRREHKRGDLLTAWVKGPKAIKEILVDGLGVPERNLFPGKGR